MQNKKPLPPVMVEAKPRRVCSVCGTASYSSTGIHPQCAEEQADAARVERLKSDKKAEKAKEKVVSPDALSPWRKRCPKCRAQWHIRKQTCECGHQFT